jgi:hypothetical protein
MLDCDRCGKTIDVCTISNGELICLDCKDEEEMHPFYEAGRKAKVVMQHEPFNGIRLLPEIKK